MSNPPKATKKPYSYEVGKQKISDDYFWLRDPNWPNVQDKEVIDYLNQENEYAKSHLDKLSDLKETIFEELKGRITLKDKSVPVRKGAYIYYTRIEEDSEYPIYCRRAVGPYQTHGIWLEEYLANPEAAPEEIILNVPLLAKDKKFFSIGAVGISNNGKFLAYSVDESGTERYKIKIIDLSNNRFLVDEIDRVYGTIAWDLNDSGFFYTPTDENWRHLKLYYHKIGTKDDKLIYEETDIRYNISISKSNSGRFLFVNSGDHASNEVRVIDLSADITELKLSRAREENILYDMDHSEDYFYIRTNQGGKNFRIARASIHAPDEWKGFLSEVDENYIESIEATKTYLMVNKIISGERSLVVLDIRHMAYNVIEFQNPPIKYWLGYSLIYSTNYEDDDIRVNHSALNIPDTTYLFEFNSQKLTTLKTKLIPSGFNPEEYIMEKIYVTQDDVKIPYSIFYRKDKFKHDGSNILYLYGYGSYGYAIPTNFRTSIISLVDRGIIFAIAHVRGGDDLGFDWYESAKFLNKKRTFKDYIAICDDLIEKKYTSSGNIIASGGSAGGLLVGAVVNMRPELFKMAIAHVPFVDVLNSMLDETLPLTPGEFNEWGNPKEPKYFDYIKSYSPYDNIARISYPPMFVTGSISDPRVGYWEPAKWVAKLRELKIDDNLIIFKTNMEQGHRGASGRFGYLYETAEEYALVLDMSLVNI
jgi:oligopeptidase B